MSSSPPAGGSPSASSKKKKKSGGRKGKAAVLAVQQGGQDGGGPSSADTPPAKLNNNNARCNAANNDNNRPPRRSCWWCCCCRCNSISLHNQLKEKTNKMHQMSSPADNFFNANESDSPPTLEEIRSWADSFDKLMRCGAGRKVFRDFLRCEYSEENILFWTACEDLKRERNPELVEEKARSIYEDYVSILSPKEVSLDSKVREIVNKNMVSPTANTFDEAQLQIYTLMHRDSYPRFVVSPLYRRMAQLSPPARKTSVSVG